MKKIGAHVSVSGGVEMAPVNALGIGADAFALLQRIRGNGLQNLCLSRVLLCLKKTARKKVLMPGMFFLMTVI